MESKQLNQFICLHNSGVVKIHPDIVKFLHEKLIKTDDDWHDARKKSRVIIRTRNAHFSDVFSVPKSYIKKWARSLSLVSVPGLYSDLDLESGRYEGGFKVWESTKDLVKFVTQDQEIIGELFRRNTRLKVLELGGGASLPSMAFLGRLIKDPDFKQSYQIHIQDYNWQVLASLTLMNFAFNFNETYFRALLETECLQLFCGDWKNFRHPYKYDIIMMSEVLYNCDNYEALHKLLDLHSRGYIVIATKDTYFGLSGSLYAWLEFVSNKKIFDPFKIIKVTTNNIPRSIVLMKRHSR